MIVEPGESTLYYWLMLEGEARADRLEPDGSHITVGLAHDSEGFGETPFLTGRTHAAFLITMVRDSVLVRFSEDQLLGA